MRMSDDADGAAKHNTFFHITIVNFTGTKKAPFKVQSAEKIAVCRCPFSCTFFYFTAHYDYDQPAPPNPFPSHVDLRTNSPSSHRRIMDTEFQ